MSNRRSGSRYSLCVKHQMDNVLFTTGLRVRSPDSKTLATMTGLLLVFCQYLGCQIHEEFGYAP